MKINRYKKVSKVLRFYSNNFGFRKPYQVLLDGTICVAALKRKINIQEQFSKYLENDIKLLTTQCIVKELELIGKTTYGAFVIIKKFGIHHCSHEKSPIPASNCILEMIENKNPSRYIIATQDKELQQKCRQLVGVPLLYLHFKSPTLEAPSLVSQNIVANKSFSNFQITYYEKLKLAKLSQGTEPFEHVIKKKKIRGPNPLSCKKKKIKEKSGEVKTSDSLKQKRRKKRRKEKKIAKEILFSN